MSISFYSLFSLPWEGDFLNRAKKYYTRNILYAPIQARERITNSFLQMAGEEAQL